MRSLLTKLQSYLVARAMKNSQLSQFRKDTVSGVSGTVLEIGFGSGTNLPFYPQDIEQLYALEPSQDMFNCAKENIAHSKIKIVHLPNSAEQIPLKNETVDYVVSTWTMCTISNPDKALQEIYRVLKPGGVFVFIEHGLSPHKISGTLQRMCTPCSRLIAGGCHLDRDIAHILKQSPLQITNLRTFPMKYKPLAFLYQGTAIKP